MRHSFLLVIIGLCICSWLFTGCASSRFIKPLDKKQTAIIANIGGPFVQYSGMGIPVPLTSVAVGHGFTKDLTCFAGLHTTALLFGVIQTDIGAVKELMKQRNFRPGVSVSPAANMMLDKWEHKFSFFPQIDAHAYWNYLKKPHYAYVGFSNWFDLHSKLANGEPQTYHWMPVIELGNTFVHHKWSYALELKYIAFNKRNISIVNYTGIGNPDNSTGIGQRGALGIYFGVTRTF
jgi:hypothetical protein